MIKQVSTVVAASMLFVCAYAGEVVRLSEPVATTDTTETFGSVLDEAVPRFEGVLIDVALRHAGGRRQDAARLLGWGRNTLTRKIKERGLDQA